MPKRADTASSVAPLRALIERRFGVPLPPTASVEHWHMLAEHYAARRALLLRQHGPAGTLRHPGYAKALLIGEAAKLILREIDPRPLKKRRRRATPGTDCR